MASNQEIVLYDIASAPPPRTFAPNPWKARYALNYKGVNYRTEFVDMPSIASVRQKMGVPANRNLPDGSPYHTLPFIHDLSTGAIIGDSFEIALYLDRTYPAAPKLFRPDTVGLTAALNSRVDDVFTRHVTLSDQMPFPAASLEKIMGMFASRIGPANMDAVKLGEADREKIFLDFQRCLSELAKAYKHVGGTTDYFLRPSGTAPEQSQRQGRDHVGPYLDGDEPAYADFIVGAWLASAEASMKPEDFARIRSWDDGLWGRVHNALQSWRTMK